MVVMKKKSFSKKRRKKAVVVVLPPTKERFIDEDTTEEADDVFVPHPVGDDVKDELSHLDGFKDYADEVKGYNLSYGVYKKDL